MKKVSFLFFITIALFSCTSEDESTNDIPSNDFDRKAMLTNIADNIILPSLTDLENKLDQLNADRLEFTENPTQTNLTTMRSSWLEAYKTWQYVEMFNIGKAEEILYSFQMNIYPTNTSDIESNINGIDETNLDERNYDLTTANNNDAVGFPAVEYMIYAIAADDASIIAAYSTDSNFRKNVLYLTDITNQMKGLTSQVRNDWLTSYRDVFVTSTANNASSAINKLVNDFIFYYEKGLRANKIGIPAGVFSTTPLPDRVEGLYSKVYSKELALESLKAVEDFFNGTSFAGSSNGLGYADYVNESTEISLTAMINDQFGIARAQLNTLNNDLSQQVSTDNSKMTVTYDELQRAVVLMKVDMLQVLNVSVDYVDADGD
ncbi:imelysin family protein [Nonlabens antarcticus]|uniref:imelysin family protein n=1 Tax=Nonlabens antarcticus TaxID=392714 RepID=UPI00189178F2|nr:imelysin family protein [Nonlabens antarcticus]